MGICVNYGNTGFVMEVSREGYKRCLIARLARSAPRNHFSVQKENVCVNLLNFSLFHHVFISSLDMFKNCINSYQIRPVASGGARGACASLLFGRSVNPISTREGGTFSPHLVLRAPLDFQTLRRPC